jgi:hypothetical protein
MADRGGGIETETRSCPSRFLGFGRRGGTRRLKLATTSGAEWRLSVGCAKGIPVSASELKIKIKLTPGTSIWVIDSRIDVAKIDLPHESIYLETKEKKRRHN